jgi:hypothetical protein
MLCGFSRFFLKRMNYENRLPGATPGFIGKGSKVVERRTQPDYRFSGHEKVYNNLYSQPSKAIGRRRRKPARILCKWSAVALAPMLPASGS